jgi:hypothetical protein
MARSKDEQDIVDSGIHSRQLLESPAWVAFAAALEEVKRMRIQLALQNGNTDYLKGEVSGIGLVLETPGKIIEAMEEILAREAREEAFEAHEENPFDSEKEFAP